MISVVASLSHQLYSCVVGKQPRIKNMKDSTRPSKNHLRTDGLQKYPASASANSGGSTTPAKPIEFGELARKGGALACMGQLPAQNLGLIERDYIFIGEDPARGKPLLERIGPMTRPGGVLSGMVPDIS